MLGIGASTNSTSLNIVRNLSTMQRAVRKTQEKLASGLRINSAADDPAGLVVSEQMRSQVASISQQIVNLETAVNKLGTADEALSTMESQLLEMRELAVAAVSGGYVDESVRDAYETTLNSSVEAFNMTVDSGAFGRQMLFDGSEGSVAEIDKLPQIDLSDRQKAEEAISAIDSKLSEVMEVHGEIGARSKNEIASMRSNLEASHINLTEAESVIRDTDFALEQARLVSLTLRVQAGTSMLAQGSLLSHAVLGLLKT